MALGSAASPTDGSVLFCFVFPNEHTRKQKQKCDGLDYTHGEETSSVSGRERTRSCETTTITRIYTNYPLPCPEHTQPTATGLNCPKLRTTRPTIVTVTLVGARDGHSGSWVSLYPAWTKASLLLSTTVQTLRVFCFILRRVRRRPVSHRNVPYRPLREGSSRHWLVGSIENGEGETKRSCWKNCT